MRHTNWKLADHVITLINNSKTVPSEFFVSLIRRLEVAISNSSSEQLQLLESNLQQILNDAVAHSPPDILKVAGDSTLHEPLAASYILGQLSFAHQLTRAASRKANTEDLFAIVNSEKFRSYFLALKDESLSGRNLADRCGLAPETVSRSLAELREYGLTDYRREGTSLVNFLTAAGKILAERLPTTSKIDSPAKSAREKLRLRTSEEFIGMPLLKKVSGA